MNMDMDIDDSDGPLEVKPFYASTKTFSVEISALILPKVRYFLLFYKDTQLFHLNP